MGILHSVARVDCLSAAAMRRLEEWSPIRFWAVDRTRLTDPLALFSGFLFVLMVLRQCIYIAQQLWSVACGENN
jgi:hypothetical protein